MGGPPGGYPPGATSRKKMRRDLVGNAIFITWKPRGDHAAPQTADRDSALHAKPKSAAMGRSRDIVRILAVLIAAVGGEDVFFYA